MDLQAVASTLSSDYKGSFVNNETGRIELYIRCSKGMELHQSRDNCHLVEGDHDAKTEYFVDGELTPRPAILTKSQIEIDADGVSTIEFEIPVGTQVRQGEFDVLGEADDGLFEFDTTIPGEYEFWFIPPFPYQEQTLKVTAK